MRRPTHSASTDRASWSHSSLIQSLIRTRRFEFVRSWQRTNLVSLRFIESHDNALCISDSGLSTLHALPTPVSRVGQKVCKFVWFDIRARESEPWNAVGDVACWLAQDRGNNSCPSGHNSSKNRKVVQGGTGRT